MAGRELELAIELSVQINQVQKARISLSEIGLDLVTGDNEADPERREVNVDVDRHRRRKAERGMGQSVEIGRGKIAGLRAAAAVKEQVWI
mgnify:CR=1 FL=1